MIFPGQTSNGWVFISCTAVYFVLPVRTVMLMLNNMNLRWAEFHSTLAFRFNTTHQTPMQETFHTPQYIWTWKGNLSSKWEFISQSFIPISYQRQNSLLKISTQQTVLKQKQFVLMTTIWISYVLLLSLLLLLLYSYYTPLFRAASRSGWASY